MIPLIRRCGAKGPLVVKAGSGPIITCELLVDEVRRLGLKSSRPKVIRRDNAGHRGLDKDAFGTREKSISLLHRAKGSDFVDGKDVRTA